MIQMRPRTRRTTTIENDHSHSAGRGITPVPAMRPPRQRPKKCQNQDHDQDRSKHVLAPSLRTQSTGAASLEAAPRRDRYIVMLIAIPDAGIPAVVQVVAVVDVVDVDVVVVVPVIPPGFRPRIDRADPIALVLEARVSAYNQEGKAVDAESVARAKVSAIAVVRNAVAVVAAALLPGAVIGLPVL